MPLSRSRTESNSEASTLGVTGRASSTACACGQQAAEHNVPVQPTR